jgi:hypothetical protein
MGISATLWVLWVIPLRSGDYEFFRYALGIMSKKEKAKPFNHY